MTDGGGHTTGTPTGDDLLITLSPRPGTEAGGDVGLVISTESYRTVRLTGQVRTVRQHHPSAPRPQDGAQIRWNYTDPARFYAFLLRPDGWELVKQDPASPGGRRILADGPTPRARLGVWHTVDVVHAGDAMAVSVDGVPTVRTQDAEHPYPAGAVGLATENAVVEFHRVRARALPAGDGPG